MLTASIVAAHLEKYGFSAQLASCGHMENVLMAGPTVFA